MNRNVSLIKKQSELMAERERERRRRNHIITSLSSDTSDHKDGQTALAGYRELNKSLQRRHKHVLCCHHGAGFAA